MITNYNHLQNIIRAIKPKNKKKFEGGEKKKKLS